MPTPMPTPVMTEALTPRDADRLAGWFAALADATRLRLLSLIAAKGEACAACDFVDDLAVSQPTVSHHLKHLHAAGLVERERRGRWIYYRLAAGQADLIGGLLTWSAEPAGAPPREASSR